jgi:drug/metabolite transporter (DMT)-like permease
VPLSLIWTFNAGMNAKLELKPFLAGIGLFYTAAVWGSTFFIVKQSLLNINPVVLVGYRFLLAGILTGIVVILRRQSLRRNLRQGLLLGVFIWLLYITQTIGLEITTAANSGLITGLFVAFVPLFSLLIFKKIPSINAIIATIVSLGGLWVLTGGLEKMNTGDMLTLVAAMAYALHILYADKYIRQGLDPYILNFQQFIFVGLASLLTGLLFKLPFAIAKIEVLWIIIFLAIFPTFSAFIVQLLAQKYTPPIRVSLILAFEPVFAVLFAWTLGGESFVYDKAIGGLLIFLALIISSVPSRKYRIL